ncbi:MAG: PepSY-associated TM helix domain-containing protein, partial [Tepidisphaeraceae bacterium]
MIRKLLNLCRALHIYTTLAALLLLLFFAVTGFIANHDDWFNVSARSVREAQGRIDPAILGRADRLDVVERLRKDHGIRLGVNSYEPDDQSIRVVFKGPGRAVEADIDRATGQVKLHFETSGLLGFLGDLHKG